MNKERKQRFKEAIHLQEMENNPFDKEDFEMFEMFEKMGWSDEECRNYIYDLAKSKLQDQ